MEPSKQSPPKHARVTRIEMTIDWPPGNVVASLLDGSEPVLVDAGMPGKSAREELLAGLAEAGKSIEDIEHLLITHPHVDHLGQTPTLLERADPTVHAPVGVRKRLNQKPTELERTVRQNGTKAGLSGPALDGVVEKSIESLEENRSLFDPDDVDHWVDHEEEFGIGDWQLRGIHTPGHQADHFCYHSDEILFSGDLLLEPFRSVMINAGLDTGVDDGVSDFYTALDRLANIDVDHIFPGHGPAHNDHEETIDRSRKSLDRLFANTREQLADGPRTALEIAAERAGKREIHYVLPEVVSVLQHLADRGEIERRSDDGVNLYALD